MGICCIRKLKQGLCINLEVWDGETDGREVQKGGDICIPMGFPCSSAGKDSSCNAGDLGLTPELGRYPGEGKGYPLQFSGLNNSMDCIVPGVTKSRTRLSVSFTLYIHTYTMFLPIHTYL